MKYIYILFLFMIISYQFEKISSQTKALRYNRNS